MHLQSCNAPAPAGGAGRSLGGWHVPLPLHTHTTPPHTHHPPTLTPHTRACTHTTHTLTGKNSTDGEAPPQGVSLNNETIVSSFLKPNVTIAFVDDFK